DTQQFVEIDGVRYSHVLDPRTGLGLTDRIAVTVVAPEGMLSDALATMLSVAGPESGAELIERLYPQVEAIFAEVDGPSE
ncbi:MAG: FAD:protein FMN transferase, partial [Rhodothermales bacterium]